MGALDVLGEALGGALLDGLDVAFDLGVEFGRGVGGRVDAVGRFGHVVASDRAILP